LAESAIRRDVRCRAQEVSTSGTLTSSSLTAPTDLLEIRRLLVDDCVQTYLTPGEWYLRREDSNDQYTLIGETIYFQSTSGDYQIDYYEAFDPLVNDNDSNWLLQNYPDIYLFGILAEVAIWSREDPSFFQSRYRSIVENIRRVENLNRYPTQPAVRAVGMTVY
jgi:hypothetical protein